MDDLLIQVLVRLANVHEQFGPPAYRDAGRRALHGIALAVKLEAERRAGGGDRKASGAVVDFPLARARDRAADQDEL